jgi:hypothetical protein
MSDGGEYGTPGFCEAGPLPADRVDEFFREGFLVFPSPQIPAAEIEWCRSVVMSLFERAAGQAEGRLCNISAREGADEGISPQLFRPSLYAHELSRWSYRKVGLAIAKQLLGPEAVLSADNTVYKPGRVGGATPWHQDEAHNDPESYQEQMTIWIALYETTVDNGALAFIPRSHLKGILPHRPNGGSSDANSIECCGGFDPREARMCPIPAGGMTIHHGRTVHGASRNLSDSPRLGYILNYKNPPVARPELGSFPWNDSVGKSIQLQRKAWLRRGGILVEALRFFRADPDNQRHFLNQITRRFRGAPHREGR